VLWISSVHVVGAVVYVYMQFFPTPFFLIIAAHYIWVFIHGSPPLICLTMNATIRKDIRGAVLRTAQQVVVELASRNATVSHQQPSQQLAVISSNPRSGVTH